MNQAKKQAFFTDPVRTVRYTAVPEFTQLLADNNHKNWDILPA
jgi:hypothetical protein